MSTSEKGQQNAPTLEENLKKALAETILLKLLSEREYYIGELTSVIHDRSDGALTVIFPYAAIYRLQQSGYIIETEKRHAPDGRRRQYFSITVQGKKYLEQLLNTYAYFVKGFEKILKGGDL